LYVAALLSLDTHRHNYFRYPGNAEKLHYMSRENPISILIIMIS